MRFPWSQTGHRPEQGVETPLVALVYYIQALNKDYVCMILINLSAAFDTVGYEILPTHLQTGAGMDGTAFEWLLSF